MMSATNQRTWNTDFVHGVYPNDGNSGNVFNPGHWNWSPTEGPWAGRVFKYNTILDPREHRPGDQLMSFASPIGRDYRAKIVVDTENGEPAFQIQGSGNVIFRNIEFNLLHGSAMELTCDPGETI